MEIMEYIISERYIDDGKSLVKLTCSQQQALKEFLSDYRIKYETLKFCPLCNHERVLLVAKKDRYGIPLNTGVCERCGLIFTLDPMTNDSLRIFYSEYYRRIYENFEGDYYEYLDKKFYYPNIERNFRIFNFLKKRENSVVVEIGCGGGWNGLKYKNAGVNYIGFDYDEELVNYGRNKYGVDLKVGSVNEAVKMGLKADFVELIHVLEHVRDPLEFLKKLKLILKEKPAFSICFFEYEYLLF